MIISGSAAHPLIFDGRCFHICYNSHLHSRTRFADNSQTHDRSQNNSPSPVSRIKKPLKMKRTYIYRILFRSHRFAGLAESVQWATLATQIVLAIGAIADPGFTTGPRWHKIALDAVVARFTNEGRRQALGEVIREHRVECGALALPAGQVAARTSTIEILIFYKVLNNIINFPSPAKHFPLRA